MACIFPSLEKIENLKQSATDGEIFFLEKIENHFNKDVSIYFNPYFNGDRPDVVIIDPLRGVIVVEVKDWDLRSYEIVKSDTWRIKNKQQNVKSPYAQVYHYKKCFYDVHINGLLEKSLKNPGFYKSISPYVFFYKESKRSLKEFFSQQVSQVAIEINELNNSFRERPVNYDGYERKRTYLIEKKKKIERDLRFSVGKDEIEKIKFPFETQTNLFPKEVYDEFMRYLSPPQHFADEGKEITYSKKQNRLCESHEGSRQKISGIAGSGKTTILAKRAVNAHMRHGEKVLILTYNLTLIMFIKDRISKVRENFSWGAFQIINYHQFMSTALNSAGIKFESMDNAPASLWESKYYSNVDLLEGKAIKKKYDTILIDEIQDYKPEWIEIIRKYFLSENGEMILYGDEKQNLYKRGVDSEKKINVPLGFGRWEGLTKSYRYKDNDKLLSLACNFQKEFLLDYNIDDDESYQESFLTVGVNACVEFEKVTWQNWSETEKTALKLAEKIINVAKINKIHPNDIAILSSEIKTVRAIDYILRKGEHKEKTLTTFESLERWRITQDSKAVERVRRNKKSGFNLNNGTMKLSTTHSFKGYESPTVFVIVQDSDTPELIYTAITRARQNIIVFCESHSRYSKFFSERLAPLSSFLDQT